MRLFIGIFLPDEVRRHVSAVLESAPAFPSLRWGSPESLHLTVKFLGSVMENQLSNIKSALGRAASRHAAFELGLAKGGAFPSPPKARVFWTGLAGETGALVKLAEDVESSMKDVGFPVEKRKFTPHLTLARPRSVQSTAEDGMRFSKLFENYKSPMFRVSSLQLTQSHLGSNGSRYEILESFSLGVPS